MTVLEQWARKGGALPDEGQKNFVGCRSYYYQPHQYSEILNYSAFQKIGIKRRAI